MKSKLTLIIPVAAALVTFSACSDKSETAPPPAPPAPSAAVAPAATPLPPAPPALPAPAAALPPELPKAAPSTVVTAPPPLPSAEPVKTVVAEKIAEVENLLNSAKTALGQSNWTELTKLLQQLAAHQLTPEQQNLVEGWKKQLQQALSQQTTDKVATEAASKIKDLLKK